MLRSFLALNRVEPGFNSGWVQIQGPPDRIAQYKAIETSPATDPLLGIWRDAPEEIDDMVAEAMQRRREEPWRAIPGE